METRGKKRKLGNGEDVLLSVQANNRKKVKKSQKNIISAGLQCKRIPAPFSFRRDIAPQHARYALFSTIIIKQ